jgi:ketosteroid isomerase-like protein
MSTRRLVALVLASAFAAVPSAATAQPQQAGAAKAAVENAIHKLEQTYIDARLKGDTAALRNLLTDDYVAIGQHGELMDKAAVLKAPDKNAAGEKFTAMEHGQVTVRVSGSTAIATGSRAIGTQQGSGQVRFTHVYVERGGRWKLMSSQVTPVAM